jgi:L-ascorbate metabolism protein UlaG (beta-lactamase superfamily)
MPIGAYKGRFQKDNHCTPEEALLMAKDMKTKYFIPIHFGTFNLAHESAEEPMKRLKSSIINYPFTL